MSSCVVITTLVVMPQLDKYIFFNHVISLTIFFLLIYVFIRGTVVPQISTTLKYRKKRLILFNEQLNDSTKILNFSKTLFDKKGKNYLNNLSLVLNKLTSFYETKSSKQILELYISNFDIIKNNNNISNFVLKNKKELKRINNLI